MGHVGDIGRGRGRGHGGFGGEATRIGPAPTAGGGAPTAPLGEGGLDMGLGGGTEGLADIGPGRMPGGVPPGLAQGGPGQGNAARNQPQTGSRPAMEAATFTEAFTQDTGGKVSTAPETLVMPKIQEPQLPPGLAKKTQERPALREGNNAPAAREDVPDAPEGFTANDTESPAARGATRVVRMADVQAGKAQTKSPERSDFGATTTTTNTRVALRTSQVKVPVRPVQDLVPPGLNKLANMAAVAKRFASDLPLLQQQVRPSELPSRDRALRAWAFFTAYAQAAAGKEGTREGLELFNKALKKEGFGEYRDARTGKDALRLALWVLEAATPEEALERALEADIEPLVALEVLLSEAAKTLEGKGKKDETGKGQELPHKPEAGKGESAQKGEKAEAGKGPDAFSKPEAGKAKDPSATPEDAKSEFATPEDTKLDDTARKPQDARISQPKPLETPRKPEDARVSQPKSQTVTDSSFTQASDAAPLERAEGQSEMFRVNPQVANTPQPVLLPPNPEILKKRTVDEESLIGRFEETLKKMDKGMRLGSNMLWNALHQLRKGPGESALEKEKWNQLAFAAMLAFVGLMLLVILVVSL